MSSSARDSVHKNVHRAALALLAEGVKPSVDKVRDRLNSTASSKTLNDGLNTFWIEIGQRLQQPNIPTELAEALQSIWNLSLDLANQTYTEQRQQGLEKMALLETERSQALQQVTAIQNELEFTKEQLQVAYDQQAHLQDALKKESSRLNTARTTATELRATLDETKSSLQSAQQQANDSVASLQKSQQDYLRSEIERVSLQDRVTELTQINERDQKIQLTLRQRLSEKENTLALSQAKSEQLNSELQDSEALRGKLVNDNEQMRQALQDAELTIRELQTQVADRTKLSKRCDEQRDVIAALRAEIRDSSSIAEFRQEMLASVREISDKMIQPKLADKPK